MKRSGTADLPLHAGRVPAWLAHRMTALGTAITEHVVLDYGAGEFLSRLSDPFWFQALGCVMGMDWHSSGITTSVMGALKLGLNPRFTDLGIAVCGGRGRHSKATPDELRKLGTYTGLDGDKLAWTSRLTARVDNNAVVDGFQLYLHSFIVLKSGEWAVVQQGMNQESGLARRYHWHSATVRDFTSEPHSAIVGANQGKILNLVDSRASDARDTMIELTHSSVAAVLRDFRTLTMPVHHDVRAKDVDLKRLGAVLAVAHDRELRDFASLLLIEGLGPRTLQSLALVAEIIHGTPVRFSDPARFAFAHEKSLLLSVRTRLWQAGKGLKRCAADAVPLFDFSSLYFALLNWTKGTIRTAAPRVQNSARKSATSSFMAGRNENQTCDSNNCNSRRSGVTGLCPATIGDLSCAWCFGSSYWSPYQ